MSKKAAVVLGALLAAGIVLATPAGALAVAGIHHAAVLANDAGPESVTRL